MPLGVAMTDEEKPKKKLKILPILGWTGGFIAGFAGFVLTVLTILKDHLKVDTYALLMHMGASFANYVTNVQSALSTLFQAVGSFSNVFSLAVSTAMITISVKQFEEFLVKRFKRKAD